MIAPVSQELEGVEMGLLVTVATFASHSDDAREACHGSHALWTTRCRDGFSCDGSNIC